jgi:hypothetical protein
LSTFNLVGVITDGKTRLDLYLLAGRGKPFTAGRDLQDIAKALREPEDDPLLDDYFQGGGVALDIRNMELGSSWRRVAEVARNTPIAELHRVDQLLGEQDGES